MFIDLNKDINLLHSFDQNRLDVVYSDDKESFQLVPKSFFTRFIEFFIQNGRLERLKNYSESAQDIFQRNGWRFDSDQIDAFYAGGLSKWDFTLFDRSTLSEDLRELLSNNLGCPFTNDPSCNFAEESTIEQARTEAELALKLGIRPKTNKGAQGSIIYLDFQRKPIGIFKKESSSDSLFSRLKRIFKTGCGFFKNQTLLCRHDKTHAEVAASVADKNFSMGLVPLTRMVTIDGVLGSFQLWSNGAIEAAEFHRNYEPDEEELYLFQLMAIYDFLFGNLDRHLENWLVGLTKMQKLERIVMIDNGSILPEEHPTDSLFDYFGRQNMYRWKDHPWSKYPFSARIFDKMYELTPAKVDNYIDNIRKALPDHGKKFLTQKRIQSLHSRAKLLRVAGRKADPEFTPRDLGQAFSSSKLKELKKRFSSHLHHLFTKKIPT